MLRTNYVPKCTASTKRSVWYSHVPTTIWYTLGHVPHDAHVTLVYMMPRTKLVCMVHRSRESQESLAYRARNCMCTIHELVNVSTSQSTLR